MPRRPGSSPRAGSLRIIVALLSMAWVTGFSPVVQAQTSAFNIAAGPLSSALDQFARAAGINLAYDDALVNGLSTAGLSGTFSVSDGLSLLLAGSGITAIPQPAGGFALQRSRSE